MTTPKLITRLAGCRALVQLIPSGVGPMRWGGELRTDDDQPISRPSPTGLRMPTSSGPPTPAGLELVLTTLTHQARGLTRKGPEPTWLAACEDAPSRNDTPATAPSRTTAPAHG